MKQYTVIDINGNTHVIMADGYSISDKNNLVFWTNNVSFSDEGSSAYLFSRFNFDNVICITEDTIDEVEIKEMSDSMVEPECEVKIKCGCRTCKHKDKFITAEPCMDCVYYNKWEAKDD